VIVDVDHKKTETYLVLVIRDPVSLQTWHITSVACGLTIQQDNSPMESEMRVTTFFPDLTTPAGKVKVALTVSDPFRP
jgi:hypothetical protein